MNFIYRALRPQNSVRQLDCAGDERAEGDRPAAAGRRRDERRPEHLRHLVRRRRRGLEHRPGVPLRTARARARRELLAAPTTPMLARLVARERVALAPVAALAHRTAHRGGAARGGRVRQLSATTAADVHAVAAVSRRAKAAAVPLSVAFVHFRASPTWFQYSTAVAAAAGVVSFIIDARKSRRSRHAPPQRHNTYGPTSTAAALRTLDTVHEPAEPEPEPAATAAAAPAAGDARRRAPPPPPPLSLTRRRRRRRRRPRHCAQRRTARCRRSATARARCGCAGAPARRPSRSSPRRPSAARRGSSASLPTAILVVAAAAAGGAEHVYAVAVADGTPRDLTPDADGVAPSLGKAPTCSWRSRRRRRARARAGTAARRPTASDPRYPAAARRRCGPAVARR